MAQLSSSVLFLDCKAGREHHRSHCQAQLSPVNTMPMSSSRGMVDQWFERIGVHPVIVGEFDDNALLKVFGQAGDGIFMVPTIIEKEVEQQYQVQVIGRTNKIREKFYAISVERIIKHPAIAVISEVAQQKLFFECS